ncbi:MAG: SGNH/GDSL hydrolase family protein [Syntrophaceae bacterium]|nr:SGNH/GDSL hydrolase family protein [Syntrophaceae bacterium]
MNYQFAAIALGPLLLAQGIYVRLVTPRLSEPEGARFGVAGAGEPLRLLIAGDSAAAGVGAENQASALSGRLVSLLAPSFQVFWKLMARTGDKTQDVLDHIESAPQENFDVAVVSAGVNDVTAGISLKKWLGLLNNLCERLQSRFGIQQVFLTSLPPMHAFPALPQPLRWYLGTRAALFNQAMGALAEKSKDREYVRPDFPLTREFIASDGFHPGPAAYALWAERMAAAIIQKRQ